MIALVFVWGSIFSLDGTITNVLKSQNYYSYKNCFSIAGAERANEIDVCICICVSGVRVCVYVCL